MTYLLTQILKDKSASYISGGNNILGDDPSQFSDSLWKRNQTTIVTIQTSSLPRERRHNRRPAEQMAEKRPDLSFDPSLEEYFSCGPRICTKIYCSVSNLAKGESVLFTIRSRLWKETVVDISQPEFVISSKIVSVVSKLPYDVDPGYLAPEVALITTHVHVVGLDKPRPIPLLIYILAVIGGLLLLGLLILCFYKVRGP